jgi:hypothetical protein
LKFVGEFVQEIKNKRSHFQELFVLDEKRSTMESVLKDELENKWHPLLEPMNIFSKEFGVDSSSASRTLSNGLDFFIIRALMLGTGNYSKPKLRFEMVKGIRDYNTIASFERILRDLIEIQIVLDNLNDIPSNSIVLIDGNLYGRLTHLMKELPLRGWYHLPLVLLDAMQKLFDECEKRDIMLVGVSKFSKTRVLTTALLAPTFPNVYEPEFLDIELLYKWKPDESGYTTPLMLGTYAFDTEILQLEREPEKYQRRYFNNIPSEKVEWAKNVISAIPYSPAILMFHMVPNVNTQPLRIDLPACNIGVKKKIKDVTPFEFVKPELVNEVVQQITIDFGGRDVYNALLYIVDREVRLGSKTVDTVYKSILGSELGFPLEYDRATRRFMS